MMKSLKLFLLILLSFYIGDRAVFFVLKNLEKRVFTGQGVGKVNSFLKVKDSVNLLVFGSSRAAHHVNLTALNKPYFNIGMDGTRLGYASTLVSTLKRKNQVVLVHLDHKIMFDSNYKGEDAYSLTYNALMNEDIRNYFSKFYWKELLLSEIAHTYAINGKVLSIVKNIFLNGDDYIENRGYEPLFPTDAQQLIFEKSLKTEAPKLNVEIEKPLKVNNFFVSLIDDISKRATINNNTLIFFTSPSLQKVDNEVKKATKNVFDSKGLIYWDHLDYFADFNISDWKDETHLSNRGAAKYSEFLIGELRDSF